MEFNQTEKLIQESTVARLRCEISTIEGYQTVSIQQMVRLGISQIDEALPNACFPLGVIHEFICKERRESAATAGFVACILTKINPDDRSIVWIANARSVYPPGLVQFGLNLNKLLFIELKRDQEILWAAEEALRCKGLSAVIIETSNATLNATRRLQLAAGESGVSGFLLRNNSRKREASAAVTSWEIRSAPSSLDDGIPGVGFPRWQVELVKSRNGRPGNWQVKWRGGRLHLVEPVTYARSNTKISHAV